MTGSENVSHRHSPTASIKTSPATPENTTSDTISGIQDPEKQLGSQALNSAEPLGEKDASRSTKSGTSIINDEGHLYPEGGLKAWSVVFGSFCGMLASFGIMNSIGAFQAYISKNQLKDHSEGTVGWIFGLYVFLSFFCGIQIGPVFDAKGPRLLILAGSICIVASVFLLGFCTQYWHFILVFGILGGLGTSLIFTPAIAAIGHYFVARRGTAIGFATTGGSIGGIVFPLTLQALIPRIGFVWSTRVLGFIVIFLVTIANILVRSRLPRKKGASTIPDPRIFRDIVFTLTTVGVYMVEWGLFVPLSYISSYGLAHGVSASLAYQLLAILNVGSFFGRWLPGYFADKIGRFNAMILTVALAIVTTLGLWLTAGNNEKMMIVYAILFGFASGSNIGLTPVCVGQLCRTENYGRYYATSYTIVSFGTLTGIPIAGQLLSTLHGQYWGLILFTALCYIAALIVFTAARVLAVGWKLTTIY